MQNEMTPTPSEYQAEIYSVLETTDASVTVKAVAGSGKTTTIVSGASRLAGASVLFCAFNTAIRDEIQRRVPASVEVRTIHQLGMKSLNGRRKLRVEDKKYRLFQDEVGLQLARDVTGKRSPSPDEHTKAQDCLGDLINFGRNHLVNPTNAHQVAQCVDQFGIDNFDMTPRSAGVFSKYLGAALEWGISSYFRDGLIDFTDMVSLPHYLDVSIPKAGVVFVDECQDLSRSRADVVRRVADRRIVAVGDPNQAIYGFAGADHRAYDELRAGIGGLELPLSVCYRCPPAVVRLAQSYVPTIEPFDGHPGGTVTDLTYRQALSGIETGDMVLSRTNARAVATCLSLLAQGKPACVKGQDVKRRILNLVKDAMSTHPWRLFDQAVEGLAQEKADFYRSRDRENAAQAILDTAASAIAVRSGLRSSSFTEFAEGLAMIFAEGRKITISTIHKAKGLEATRVFLLDWDRLPLVWRNQKEHEAQQERNLCYVAVTRALRDLFLVQSPQAN